MTRLLPVVALAAAAALAPAAASAAPPWSAPAPIQGAPQSAPVLAFPAAGPGLLAWTNPTAGPGGAPPDGSNATSSGGSTLREDTSTTPARRISGRFGVLRAEGYGTGRVVTAGERVVVGMPVAVLGFGRTTGAVDFHHTFRIGRRSRVAGLDVSPRGDVALLVLACPDAGCRSSIPYLVTRRAGGRVGKPMRLARRARATFGAVAVNARGDALAAWETPRRGTTGTRAIRARLRTAGGRLGRTQALGTGISLPQLRAVLSDDRSGAVAWLGQRIAEGYLHGAEVEYSAARPGGRFGAETLLERLPVKGTGRYVDSLGVALVERRAGQFDVVWTGIRGGRYVVKHGPLFSEFAVISDSERDTILDDVATGAGGRLVVAMREGIGGADPRGPGPVRGVAAVRAASGAVSGPETVTEPDGYVRPLDVAIDAQNRAWAAWDGFDPADPGVWISTRAIP